MNQALTLLLLGLALASGTRMHTTETNALIACCAM
jgi:hypothetical protein